MRNPGFVEADTDFGKTSGGEKKKKKTSEKKTGTYDMFGQNQWTIPGMVQRLSNSDSEPTSIIPKKKTWTREKRVPGMWYVL